MDTFNDYLEQVDAEPESIGNQTIEYILDTYFVFLKQIKGAMIQEEFLEHYKDKYKLTETFKAIEKNMANSLINLLVYQEKTIKYLTTNVELKQMIDDRLALFNFLLYTPETLEKHIEQQFDAIKKDLLVINNQLLFVPDERLKKERVTPVIQKEIKLVKQQIHEIESRIKKVRKLSKANVDELITQLEGERLVNISVLIYYLYWLSNEDINKDDAITKIFPEVDLIAKDK